MTFDPEGFLNLAQDILASAPVEAGFRTAVSRCYYAVHLRARENLKASGELTPTYSGFDHEQVIELLRSRRGPEGDRVDRLRVLRNRADYRTDRSIVETDARHALSLANAVWPKV